MSNSENSLALDEYIQKNKTKSQSNETHRIILNGQSVALQVYNIPLKYLYFNIENGRFAADYKDLVKKRGGKILDSTNEKDAKIIENLLLELDPTQTKVTMRDIKNLGQKEAGIITHDGFVINGNRRLSILLKLAKDDSKFDQMRVVRLPQNVDRKDLYKLEIGLQMGKEEILPYSPINELLKLKEGKDDKKLSVQEIASALYGHDKEGKEVQKKLDRLDLIDNYLAFFGKQDQYKEVERLMEHFIDAQSILENSRDRISDEELYKIKQAMWGLIRDGVTHLELRDIKKMIRKNAEKALNRIYVIADSVKPSLPESVKEVLKPETPDDPDWELPLSPIRTQWENARDELRVKEHESDIPKLLSNVKSNLEAIRFEAKEGIEQLKQKQCQDMIKSILNLTDKLEKFL